MIAIRAAGVPLRRVVAMVLPIALVFSAVDMVVAGWAAPRAQQALRQWLDETAPPSSALAPAKPLWFRKDGDVIRIGHASSDGTRLEDLRVYRRDAKGDLVERLTARSAMLRHGDWVLTGPSRWRVAFDRAQIPLLRDSSWRTTLRPREIVEVRGLGSLVSPAAAIRSLQGAASNQSPNFFLTRLNRLLAEPLGLLVMVLLAAPLALSHGRSDRSLGLFLYGIGGGLLYLVSDGLMTVWGQLGLLPPLLAAWGAPLAFAAGALTVLLYAES
jgi:lipopolysaccharide export system permease protein